MAMTRRWSSWGVVGLVAVVTACGQHDGATTTSAPSAPPSAPASTTVTSPAAAYQSTLLPVRESRGTTTIDVQLPQVTGGAAAVRDRFNSGMRTALDEVVGPDSNTTLKDGSLAGDERSMVTTITPHVVAGVAIFNWYAQGAAHPNNSVATITIDADTAKPILLSDVFIDQQSAAERLSTLVTQSNEQVGPLSPPSIESFLNWVPMPDGFHTYVPVVHALGDYLPVTVPWDQISDVMKPEMKTKLIP